MKRPLRNMTSTPLFELAGTIGEGGKLTPLSGEQGAEQQKQWSTQAAFVDPVLLTLVARLEAPGIRERYVPLISADVVKRSAMLSDDQKRLLYSSLFLNELHRLAANVDASGGLREDAQRSIATGKLFEAGRLTMDLARLYIDPDKLPTFVQAVSALVCAAARCGNLDLKSEIPKWRATNRTKPGRDAKLETRRLRQHKIRETVLRLFHEHPGWTDHRIAVELMKDFPEIYKGRKGKELHPKTAARDVARLREIPRNGHPE